MFDENDAMFDVAKLIEGKVGHCPLTLGALIGWPE